MNEQSQTTMLTTLSAALVRDGNPHHRGTRHSSTAKHVNQLTANGPTSALPHSAQSSTGVERLPFCSLPERGDSVHTQRLVNPILKRQ